MGSTQEDSMRAEDAAIAPMTPMRRDCADALLAKLLPDEPPAAELSSVETAREQYDTQSSEYKQSKLAPWRELVEKHTVDCLLDAFGGVRGKRVIDLACGDGHYSRWLKQRKGVASVLGVDLSSGMVALAQKQEDEQPLGIEYVCCDAAKLGRRDCDVVFAAYLLNYAQNYEELVRFLNAIYAALPKDGIFITIQNSPHDEVCHHPELRKYGFVKTCDRPGEEGATIKYTFFDGDRELCTVDNYFLSRRTYERAFRQAGFRNVGFMCFSVSPQGKAGYDEGYWDDLLDSHCIEGIFALK